MAPPQRRDYNSVLADLDDRITRLERAASSFGSPSGVLLADVIAPPGAPSTGGVIYVEAGALKYLGDGGTQTTLGSA